MKYITQFRAILIFITYPLDLWNNEFQLEEPSRQILFSVFASLICVEVIKLLYSPDQKIKRPLEKKKQSYIACLDLKGPNKSTYK